MSNNINPPSKLLLKPADVCELVGISIATLNRWLKAKKLPQPIYVNGIRYWRKADVENHINLMFKQGGVQ